MEEALLKAEIIKYPNKAYWYYPLVGKTIELTGEKWVDDGLHERPFVPVVDDGVRLSMVSYTTTSGNEVCATDIRILE